MVSYTSEDDFKKAYSTLFETFNTGRTKNLGWRKWQLKQCWWMLEDNAAEIVQALRSDFNRHEFESQAADIAGAKGEILSVLQKVEEWAADEKINAGFFLGTLGKARIRKEPLGVAFIIGPWNFPFLLVIVPMLSAIAAGCCVMLKPSEVSSASEKLLVKMVREYMDPLAVRIVTGGAKETTFMLKHRFDHIFYTGSNKVAPFITAAAARHLTPTVLELGGQAPAIVTKTANIDMAAKRVAYSKYLNAGQICLAVNHVFADPSIHDAFVQRLVFWNNEFQSKGTDAMGRLINEQNFDRLDKLLSSTDGEIFYGGQRDRSIKSIQPTIVTEVSLTDSLLSEEIFGPICPIIKADYVSAYHHMATMPHPLALYIFSSSQTEISEILAHTNSGGVTVNDVFTHALVPNAPFGGVGASGTGYSHGVHGFNAFTHQRAVVEPPLWLERLIQFRYPPYQLASIKNVAVPNSIGFKRGETMQDQKIGKTAWLSRAAVGWWVGAGIAVVAMGFADERSGSRVGVARFLDSVISKIYALNSRT